MCRNIAFCGKRVNIFFLETFDRGDNLRWINLWVLASILAVSLAKEVLDAVFGGVRSL